MKNKLHEDGFIQALSDLSTKEGAEGLFDQDIDTDAAMRNAASYLAVILRGMAPGYPSSPSLSWLERKIENAAKGEDPELLEALFKPIKLRGRPSLPKEMRRRIAGYVAVQSEVFYRPLTTGDYNDDSAFAATASRFKQSVSTVRRCAKEFFPDGIPGILYQEMTQDQIDAFWSGFHQAKYEDDESFLIAYRWLASEMTDQQRDAAIEYSQRNYGQDLFTLFAEADSGFGFDEHDVNRALAWQRGQLEEHLAPLGKLMRACHGVIRDRSDALILQEIKSNSIFHNIAPPWKNDKQRVASNIIDHAISCSNFQIDLDISEENDAP